METKFKVVNYSKEKLVIVRSCGSRKVGASKSNGFEVRLFDEEMLNRLVAAGNQVHKKEIQSIPFWKKK